MRRRYTFSDTDTGALRFALVWTAFANRGNQADAKQRVTKEDRRSESRIVGALKAISEPKTHEKLERGQPDLRARMLCAGGGCIELDQPDFRRLQEYVESMQWAAVVTDTVAELEDSLEADAEKVEPEQPAKLSAVPRTSA